MARPKGSRDSKPRKKKISVENPLQRDSVTGRLRPAIKIDEEKFLKLGEETFESPRESNDEWKPNQDLPPKPEKVVVEIDTTEESKLFLKGAFEIPAGLLNDRRLALMEDELEAIAPSWKKIYDKHIKPQFGENAELYIFAIGMAGIVGKRIPFVAEDIRKLKDGRKSKQFYPSYSSEERNGQVHTHEAPPPGGQGVSESNL